MSNTNEIVEQDKPEKQTIGSYLMKNKEKILNLLPSHIKPERMLSILMNEIRRVPALQECTIQSLFGAFIQCSQLGLEVGGSQGHAYLIPYDISKNVGTRDKPRWIKTKECQFMLGYRGMIDLALRSNEVLGITAHEVYTNDEFDYGLGINEFVKHKPNITGKRGEIYCVYAIAHLRSGLHLIDILDLEKIESARLRSKTANSTHSPWKTDYDEMARKTAVRRLFKYLPSSPEFRKAIELDDKAENGEQDNRSVIEGEFDHLMKEASEVEVGVPLKSKADEVNEILNPKDGEPQDAPGAKEFFGE